MSIVIDNGVIGYFEIFDTNNFKFDDVKLNIVNIVNMVDNIQNKFKHVYVQA